MNASPVPADALRRFAELLERARRTDLREPTAAVLATADGSGAPSARTVLLKSFDERGFVFFTNLRSRKGRQLVENPRAALVFFWQPLMEQVHVEGEVEPVSGAEADDYWKTRPRKSQLGAWASRQSEVLESRRALIGRFLELSLRYAGRKIPRPEHWSGFRLVPDRVEFWKSKPHRLHERVLYEHTDDGWKKRLLNP